MTNLKTKEATLQALKRPPRELSAEELNRQRVSFIMGSVDMDSPITRAEVVEILAKQAGRAG
jgi:hypothetical protein